MQVAILRWDEDYGGVGGWLLDTVRERIAVPEIVPDRWTVLPWISWSPDGRFALLVASGEVTMGDMAVIDATTGTSRSIHYQDFTRDHGKTQVELAEYDNLRWLAPDRYSVSITVRCNTFQVSPCDISKVISNHIAQLDLLSETVQYTNGVR